MRAQRPHKYCFSPYRPLLEPPPNICAAIDRTFIIIFVIDYSKFSVGWHARHPAGKDSWRIWLLVVFF